MLPLVMMELRNGPCRLAKGYNTCFINPDLVGWVSYSETWVLVMYLCITGMRLSSRVEAREVDDMD